MTRDVLRSYAAIMGWRTDEESVSALCDYAQAEGDDSAFEDCVIHAVGRTGCLICGDAVVDLDEHVKKHERPADPSQGEDARGGAPRP